MTNSMKIQVLNQKGSKDSKIDFPESMSAPYYNFDLVHQFLTTYVNNSHQNTRGQKNRSSVRGGGKKPWKQKGTGRARAGTIRSPLWRSGGVTFAHVYKPVRKKKVNKKMYKAAMRSIFSRLAKEDRLILLSDLLISEPPKTSEVKSLISNLNISDVVFLLPEKNNNFEIASRNLYQVQVQTVDSINPTALINCEKVVLTHQTLESLSKRLSK